MKKRINLLYSERKSSSYIKLPFLKKSLFLDAVSLFIIIGVVVTIYQASMLKVYSKKLVSVTNNFNKTKNDFESSKGTLEMIKKDKEKLIADKARLDDKLKALKDLEEGSFALSKYLVGIVKLVPEDLWVKNIILNPETMKIKGETTKFESISNFMIELDKSKIFNDTNFSYTERPESEKKEKFIEFEIITHPAI